MGGRYDGVDWMDNGLSVLVESLSPGTYVCTKKVATYHICSIFDSDFNFTVW